MKGQQSSYYFRNLIVTSGTDDAGTIVRLVPLVFFIWILGTSSPAHHHDSLLANNITTAFPEEYRCCTIAVAIFPALIWLDVWDNMIGLFCISFVLMANLASIIKPSIMDRCHLTIWLLIFVHLRDLCKRTHVDSDWMFSALQHMIGS